MNKNNTQHRKEERQDFTWKPKSGKNHGEEENNSLVTGFTEIVCQSLGVVFFFFAKRKMRETSSHGRRMSIYT